MVAPDLDIHRIHATDTSLLQQFLETAGNSLETFRYFASRPLTVITNHLVTIVLSENGMPIGYGHLDKDGETVWLGIAVKEQMKGKGFGRRIMKFLVTAADELQLQQIMLTVDKSNSGAIALYKQFGFVEAGMINEQSVKMIRKSNHA